MTPEQSAPQYASVEQPFGIKPPVVHCPICGHAVCDADGAFETPCEHLAFVYLDAIGDFPYESAAFTKRMDAFRDDEDFEGFDWSSFPNFLKQFGYDNKMLALGVTYGGMACGPVWYLDIYGFDYGTLAEESAEESTKSETKRTQPITS